ncbi:MAG TPA: hypothetical protein G4O03_06225 [Dehalococcoidia bacterium]|nr:hypothetical protein [Dehalococcoidia bacterium]
MSRVNAYLYAEPTARTLRLDELIGYVKALLPGLAIEPRDSFITFNLGRLSEAERGEALGRLAEGFARARVRDPLRELQDFEPLPGEISYERKRLADPLSRAKGILYDGHRLLELLRGLLPPEERSLAHLHIVFTNQLFGTWREDGRYHAAVSLYSFPCLLSTTGVVEAPAKPREYYLLRQQYASLVMGAPLVGSQLELIKGRYIDYDDERLTEVMKGYVMQSIFYHFTLEPFCPDPHCRLYNAHWQEEVIHAQLDGDYEFCPHHQRLLEKIGREI